MLPSTGHARYHQKETSEEPLPPFTSQVCFYKRYAILFLTTNASELELGQSPATPKDETNHYRVLFTIRSLNSGVEHTFTSS